MKQLLVFLKSAFIRLARPATARARVTVRVMRQVAPDRWELLAVGHRCMLNLGITEMLNLISGNGTPTAFDNANARIGVGDGTTGPSPAQTALVGTNTEHAAMDVGYPTVTDQTVTWRATFPSGDAEFEWCEIVVDNGTIALDREVWAVSERVTKVTGDVWRAEVELTLL